MISRRSLDRAEFVQEKIEDSPIKITDIDFETGRLLTYSEALVHQYKFWCRSEADDYVRKPGFAGFFDGYLRAYSMDAEGERKVAEDLLAKTREIFGGKLELAECRAEADLPRRFWKVYVTPVDLISRISGSGTDEPLTVSVENGFVTPSIENNSGLNKALNPNVQVKRIDSEYRL